MAHKTCETKDMQAPGMLNNVSLQANDAIN